MDATAQEIGPYRLDGLLGQGGMGEVYRAWDHRLERRVAVKRLRGDSGTAGRRDLLREARACARLGHPAVVQVFDVLEEGGTDWIVMELVDGPDLATLLGDGPLDVGLVLDYGRQIADGLAAAHAAGIVHRDLKTENVMVLSAEPGRASAGRASAGRASAGRASAGRVKILDFGLAQTSVRGNGDTARRSPYGTALPFKARLPGTPRAMSPEQARGRQVDFRSDLFALGVLLYELLTARSPFHGRTLRETLTRIVSWRQASVRRFNPRVPKALADLVDSLLAKEPAERPSTAEAVATALGDIAAADPRFGVGRSGEEQSGHAATRGLRATAAAPAAAVAGPQEVAAVKALLVSDIVGSTALLAALGDVAAAELFRRHDRLARDLLTDFGGLEIDKTDGFLMLFDRAWNAVRYALAYHAALRVLGDETGVGLGSRVAIHLGEVILRHNPPDDVARGAKPVEAEGIAKPTAGRLMSLAEGGQTLLTRAAYEVARCGAAGELAATLRWIEHGPYLFKGVANEIDVFEVGVEGTAPLRAPAGSVKVRPVTLSAAGAFTGPVPDDPPARLRDWAPPALPAEPYPVLLPYTHPELLAGRETEIDDLATDLRTPVLITGLYAPSGTGKSSLLLAGLVPRLRAPDTASPGNGSGSSARAVLPIPVACDRHPWEPGVASRLLGDLLEGVTVADEDWRGFVERLAEVEQLTGEAPVLVLDQFERVLQPAAKAARVTLGILLAATACQRPGLGGPLCRWLLAYRKEYHGAMLAWLPDVLRDAAGTGVATPGVATPGVATPGVDSLPHDLSDPDRFQSFPLSPLGTPPAAGDPLAEAARVFLTAIEKPLTVERDGARVYPWHFAPGHAERLARAFARTRLARPGAPLAPELQVTLAHLLAEAGADGTVTVPEEVDRGVEEALEAHLRRALESAFPADRGRAAVGRAQALLALRELATPEGKRGEGLPAERLAKAIGDGGREVLEKLASPLTRLVLLQEADDGPRYVLSHDRMADVVVRMVEEESRRGRLLVDGELLALRHFVTLKTALFRTRQENATRVPRRHYRRIAAHADALLSDDERRDWWEACRRRRRADRWRSASLAGIVVVLLALVAAFSWSRARHLREHEALLARVTGGAPEAALDALLRLTTEHAGGGELLGLLRQRPVPMDVLERGLGELALGERSAAVLEAVELALPWVEETPDDPALIANLVWALDYAPGRDAAHASEARAWRERVLAPLRRQRPPPPLSDFDWVEVPAGTAPAFRMSSHEVTRAEYRLLVPGPPGQDEIPAGSVDWYQAYTYAAWLGGRLPTGTEWEHAARAGCVHAACKADGSEARLDEVAWTLVNAERSETGGATPSPVMRLSPNPWGLYDMLGNLWEWTADWYTPDDPVDPWGPTTGTGRTLRGGSWMAGPAEAQVTVRAGSAPGSRFVYQGFRVVIP